MTQTAEAKYSPGLEGVIAGETAISTLAGGLSYRGYRIEELAANAHYEGVAHLVLNGELPTTQQLQEFHGRLAAASCVPQEILSAIKSIPAGAPTMDVLRSGASLLAHWDPDTADNSHAANLRKAERLLAQLPVIVTARHRFQQGQAPVAADPALSLPANFLYMLHGQRPSERAVEALDKSYIMYAEHEFNASAFVARCVCSTLSDLHSSITAAIGTLKGPLHGGANERALEVLMEVGTPQKAEAWIKDALARKVKVMGFGHRVYKQGDPRAVLMKKLAAEVAAETGNQALEETAEVIEQTIWREKKIPPNVDWPCARLYHYLGLPPDLFTPLFVLARVAGWSAHVTEQLDHNRIMRPAALYRGPALRPWKPIASR
jgi:citrate synthase